MNDKLEARRNPDLDLVDALITAVIVLDRDLRVVRVNAAAQSLFATSETKLKQQSLKDVFPGADELADAARRALDESRSFTEWDMELRGTRFNTATVGYTVTPLWHERFEPKDSGTDPR